MRRPRHCADTSTGPKIVTAPAVKAETAPAAANDAAQDQPAQEVEPAPQPNPAPGPAANDPGPADDVKPLPNANNAPATNGQKVEVGSFGQIDLHVKDLPLTKVLQLLSIQSKRNIVTSRDVTGKISADLYDVGFYEALDAVLHTNGFGYVEEGNLITVYTQDEIDQMEKANRKAVTKVVRLNYITATDASAFVSPLLSGSGSISVSGEAAQSLQPSLNDAGANSYAHSDLLVIHDYADNIEQITDILADLDKRPKQVRIKATVARSSLERSQCVRCGLRPVRRPARG